MRLKADINNTLLKYLYNCLKKAIFMITIDTQMNMETHQYVCIIEI